MMKQYGLKTKSGLFLPRDAMKRGNGLRLLRPDLWQDDERAEELAKKYDCEVIVFNVSEQL
jgi:hypothetical protein